MTHSRLFILLILSLLSLVSCATTHTSDSYRHTISVFNQSPEVVPYFNDAYGYAVFPTVGKGGLIIGGAYGIGRVFRQGVAIGSSSLVKMSIGAQMGGQAFSEIIFFQDQRAFDAFISGSFEFDATASAVAITAGAQATAGTMGPTAGANVGTSTSVQAPTSYTKGSAVFIHTKGGLMYEAAIGGQKFTYHPY